MSERPGRLTLLVGLLAATPVLLAAIRLFGADWTPVGDNAVIALRSYDVLTLDPPLLGQFSSSSEAFGFTTYSPGPLLYWLLAIPSRLGAGAMTVVVTVVNVACVVGTVALARRRGGDALMIVTAAAIAVMCGSVVSKVLADIWNPAASLLPFMLLVFVMWSIAAGEFRLLPLGVLLASFVMQGHLTHVVPAIGMFAVAGVALWTARDEIDAAAFKRSALIALIVGAVCWSAPVVQTIADPPGNFVQLARSATADKETTGFAVGREALVRTAGVPPWWLEPAEGANDRFGDLGRPPGTLRVVTAVLVILALVAVTAAGVRRRRRDVAAAGAIGLVLLGGITAVASATPTAGLLGLVLGYTLWWASVAGMFVYVALGWAATQLLPSLRVARRVALPALAVAGAVAAVVMLVSAGAGEDSLEPTYQPAREVAERVERAVPTDSSVIVSASVAESAYRSEYDVDMASAYALRRHGATVLHRATDLLGERYSPRGKQADAELRIAPAGSALPRGAQEIARVRAGVPPRPIVVWLLSRR